MKIVELKTYSVLYEVTVGHEAIVKAKNMDEAANKVLEVIGEPVKITQIWEITKKSS